MLRTEDYFRERGAQGDVAGAKRLGRGNEPVAGDDLFSLLLKDR